MAALGCLRSPCPARPAGEGVGQLSGSTYIGDGLVWQVRPSGAPLRPSREETEAAALLAPPANCAGCAGCAGSTCCVLLAPEDDFGRRDAWDARVRAHDLARTGPPGLDQIAVYLRQVQNATRDGRIVVHVTSLAGRAAGAVLVGASLVLLRGLSPEESWAELLRSAPAPSPRPAEAWDRFPAPSSKNAETTASSLRVVDCLAGLFAACRKGWFEGPDDFDIVAWRMLRSKFDASWVIPGELLAVATKDGRTTWLDKSAVSGGDVMRPSMKDSLGSITEGGISALATSCGSASEDDDNENDDNEEEVDCPPRLQRATPLLGELPVFRSFCFDIPDERGGKWNDDGPVCSDSSFHRSTAGEIRKDDSIVQVFKRSGIGLLVRLGEHPSSSADVELWEASIQVVTCEAPDSPDTLATQAVCRRFLGDCELHRASPGVAAGIVLNGHFAPDGLGVLLAAYVVERHRMDGPVAHGWLRICRPGSVPTPGQEQLVRKMRPVAPTPYYLADKLASFARKGFKALS